jgi:hypothetical protein
MPPGHRRPRHHKPAQNHQTAAGLCCNKERQQKKRHAMVQHDAGNGGIDNYFVIAFDDKGIGHQRPPLNARAATSLLGRSASLPRRFNSPVGMGSPFPHYAMFRESRVRSELRAQFSFHYRFCALSIASERSSYSSHCFESQSLPIVCNCSLAMSSLPSMT